MYILSSYIVAYNILTIFIYNYFYTDNIRNIIYTKLVDHNDVAEQLSGLSAKWYTIGNAFRVDDNELDSLETSNRTNIQRLQRVVRLWHDDTKNIRNWDAVLKVVEGRLIKNLKVAGEIREWLAQDPQFTTYTNKPDVYPRP